MLIGNRVPFTPSNLACPCHLLVLAFSHDVLARLPAESVETLAFPLLVAGLCARLGGCCSNGFVLSQSIDWDYHPHLFINSWAGRSAGLSVAVSTQFHEWTVVQFGYLVLKLAWF